MRLLVLDEPLEVVPRLQSLLAGSDWETRFVGSLDEFHLALKTWGQPDMVIVNLTLPLTAWQLAQHLKQLGRSQRGLVLVDEPAAPGLEHLKALTGIECLARPATPASLDAALRAALERRRAPRRPGGSAGPRREAAYCGIIGHSKELRHVIAKIKKVAPGDANVCIMGGTEACITPMGIGGFAAMRALSTRNDEPARASRPWDRDRDGFVVGEGAGILVLEELEEARRRGAQILAEVTGYGMSADAFHVTAPPANGDGAYRVMRNAMRDAGIQPDQVDYINAHGTSTEVGDRAETAAVKRAFGGHAYKVAVSSTKSMTGHLLGGAGGLEAGITVMAIRDQVAPPTINLENPDEGCDLDYVPNQARPMKIEYALSNSFGFGGTNGCLIFRRYQE